MPTEIDKKIISMYWIPIMCQILRQMVIYEFFEELTKETKDIMNNYSLLCIRFGESKKCWSLLWIQ